MPKVTLALATVAALFAAAPLTATVTTIDYSIAGDGVSGVVALDYDDATSLYALNSLSLNVGESFDLLNTIIYNSPPEVILAGPDGGVGIGANDFAFDFQPALATQTAAMSYNIDGMGILLNNVTIDQTGSNGTATSFAIGGAGYGSLTLDFDPISTFYSLNAFHFIAGPRFGTSDALLFNSDNALILYGSPGGLTFEPDTNDFGLLFDPMAAVQTTGLNFNLAGLPFTGGGKEVTITRLAPAGVPEPSTWMMMLLGFGAMGVALRRRRQLDPMLSNEPRRR